MKRTNYTPNEFISYKNCAEICLYNMVCEEIARTKIDLEDVNKCKKHKWFFNKEREQVGTRIKRKILLLHRYLLNAKKGQYVDHINHDTLDNRKSNLRICTNQENAFNTKLYNTNKSGCKGVYYHKTNKNWYTQIRHNGKTQNIGSFKTKKEAIIARIKKEKELFGDFCNKKLIKSTIKKFNIKKSEILVYTNRTDKKENRIGKTSTALEEISD